MLSFKAKNILLLFVGILSNRTGLIFGSRRKHNNVFRYLVPDVDAVNSFESLYNQEFRLYFGQFMGFHLFPFLLSSQSEDPEY